MKSEELDKAVIINNVSKSFRLYDDRSSSLKEAVLGGLKRRRFTTFWALKDISFDVEKSSTIGVIGENGSGKSTLLKILTRVYKPTEGKVTMQGKVSGLLELGAGFHMELTGRENIYLNGSILGLKRKEIDSIFDEIVTFSEVADFLDTPVKHYSSGMFVKLGFSVAINVDPDILLIDEVIAVGDEHFQRKCHDKIIEFKKSKKTIIIVSHALEELRNLCDTAVWLHEGRLQKIGPAGKVIDSYLENVNISEERLARRRRIDTRKLWSDAHSGKVEGKIND